MAAPAPSHRRTTNGHNIGRSGGSFPSAVVVERLGGWWPKSSLILARWHGPAAGFATRPAAERSRRLLDGDQSPREPVAGEHELTLGLVERVERAYRGTDVLLIDDIQFLASKVKTKEEFFQDHMESERGGGAGSDGVPNRESRIAIAIGRRVSCRYPAVRASRLLCAGEDVQLPTDAMD